jgi:serine/threonine-protein kinase
VVLEATASAMKVCAVCGGRYPSDALFCPTDGSPLENASKLEADDPYLGQEISGHIEIRQVVGVGAMGRVYRAFQRGIDRDVAVKILHRELSANAQLVSRFTREAKVASRLQHPNVVSVLLAGQLPDRALYMVMEFLDGLSLQSALAASGGALSLPRALHIALQLCEAAGEAHAQGIVHRDLKPENVMLVRRGSDPDFVKVLDFGIARINWGETSVATAAGLIFGTARYISPEGAQGQQVTPASDVYSIGTLVYQMLSGRTPFDGDQAVGLLVQQIHDPAPPLRSLPRAAYVPEPIADVIMASLAKDPAKREPDARSFGHALFDAAKAAGLSPDELSRPHMKRTSVAKIASAEKATNGSKPTAATAKWEPPTEFQARLADAVRTPSSPSIDDTMDDDDKRPSFPTVAKTMPGEMKTQYETPAASVPVAPPSTPRRPSGPELPAAPEPPPRSRWGVVLAFFVLGAALAGLFAWKTGRIGGGDDDESHYVTRATDAMYKNHFSEPAGDNVKDITDEGLKRFPNDPKLLDVRVRSAQGLCSQAIAQRSAGDVLEALRLARLAHELDPNDASTKRLVEQYESEVANFSPSAAPTLAPMPPPKPGVAPVPATSVQVARIQYTALVDLSVAAPKVGQTVELTARVAPNKGDFSDPGFTVSGPSAAPVRVPAATTAPGVFKTTYSFTEAGKFDIAFSASIDGKSVNAKRTVAASGGATALPAPAPAPSHAPAPAPAPAPPPAPAGSVKWM